MWLDGGRPEEAREHLLMAAEAMPESAEVHYRLATAHRLLGEKEDASAALARFGELQAASDREDWNEKELGVALNEAQRLAASNRLEEALARVDRILAKAPETDRGHGLRAKILFSLARHEEALAAVREAVRLMPSRVEHHYLLGRFLHALQRPQEAEQALRRALALDPGLEEARSLLSTLKTQQPP